jgi:hypothetical protein
MVGEAAVMVGEAAVTDLAGTIAFLGYCPGPPP